MGHREEKEETVAPIGPADVRCLEAKAEADVLRVPEGLLNREPAARQLSYMRDDWFERLITAFDKIVREHAVFIQAFGIL